MKFKKYGLIQTHRKKMIVNFLVLIFFVDLHAMNNYVEARVRVHSWTLTTSFLKDAVIRNSVMNYRPTIGF
jgi:hypothetical protein